MLEDGKAVLRDWVGAFSDYRRWEGMLIPMKGTATWRLESGESEYFRGEVTSIEYDV